ncbi:hypothetical protein BJF82_00540 [Kytococcus sp. CUA-901]|nr:hypothetical protein BJF82_00540 [Kytococcus sp. CUA-901]
MATSISKMMVATAALQEVHAKRWTLRTTIDDVLPGLWPGWGRVTLQQLLSHTSGMLWRFRPGEGYYDSNTGFVVAGMMLERARRTRLEKLLRDRVFSKAGMNQSRLYISDHVDFRGPRGLLPRGPPQGAPGEREHEHLPGLRR